MLKQTSAAKIPTGYALKKRLLKLEYQTKIVGLDGQNAISKTENAGDFRIIVLRTSKITGVAPEVGSTSSAKVITKRIKKTVFNTIEGIKGAKTAWSPSRENEKATSLASLGGKLPVTYVYSVSPPAKNLKEQYEHLALLAPYIPMKALLSKTSNDNTTAGFIGCLISSPKNTEGSNLVFYYPSQLKTWLGHLVSDQTEHLGLVKLLQSLDITILNLLTQLNSSLNTLCVISNIAANKSKDSK